MSFVKKIILFFFLRIAVFFYREKITILMFHGVMGGNVSNDWLPLRPQLSPRLLERYLLVLSRYYKFVSIDQAIDMLAGNTPLQPYSIVLTFDDGLRNFKEYALPVLKKYAAPATVYVATDHVEHQIPFWFDRLDYALQLLEGDPYQLEVEEEVITFIPGDRKSLARSYRRLRNCIKKKQMSDEGMQDFFCSIAKSIEKKYGKSLQDIFAHDPWSGILTWPELEELVCEGVTIGSHTMSHHRLTFLSSEKADRELLESKKAIEQRLGIFCKHFCYPNGSCNKQVADQVRKAGYLSAVTTKPGFNRIGDDCMQLHRFHVSYGAGSEGEAISDLLYRISGLEALFSRIKGLFLWK